MHIDSEQNTEGAPEWMVSFADMITILMSFFVVMFSIASGESKDGKRTKQENSAIESLNFRFGPKWRPFMAWTMMPGNSNLPGGGKGMGSPAPVPAVGDPGGTMLVKKKEKARIKVDGQGDTIAIGGPIRFEPSIATPAAGQEAMIKRITEELAGKRQEVEIVALATDLALPPGSAYRDRWQLAYARCRAAADLLTAQSIEPQRLRLSVVPGNVTESRSDTNSEANAAVQIYLSAMMPRGGKGAADTFLTPLDGPLK